MMETSENSTTTTTTISTRSTILDLESLSKKYDTLLIQYNQVQADYINSLNNKNKLTTIQGSIYWGSGKLADTTNTKIRTLNECSALCSKTTGCTGATYNKVDYGEPMCWLRSGDGNVITAGPNNYAIVPITKKYLLTLKSLNSQLTETNNKIMTLIQNNRNDFDTQINERSEYYNLLKKNYDNLESERLNILDKINSFDTLDEAQKTSNLKVNKNYGSYILLMILLFICVFFISKMVIGGINGDSR
uniref:Apple domain-containing protein n=1 Tax=viral metagenome TaxID=1070528 RepID=A0A6C0DK32_9ZZZZ